MTVAYPSADPGRSGSSPSGRAGITWTSVAVSALLVAATVSLAGAQQVLARLEHVDTRWLAAAFAIGCVQLGLLGLRWSRVARELGIDLAWFRATTEYALSLLGNQLLPSGFAGDGLRGVRQARATQQSGWLTFEALALDRASGQLGLWLVIIISAPLSMRAGVLRADQLGVGAVAITAAAVACWLLLFRVHRTRPYAARMRPAVARAARILFSRRATLHLPLSVLLVLCSTLQLYVSARALGVHLPWAELAWLAPLILLAASIPTFFGGWGIREGACALLFASAGLPESAGVAVSLVYGVFTLIISLPAVAVLVFDTKEGVAAESPWTYANAASMIAGALLAAWFRYPPLLGFVAGFCCFILVARDRGYWTPRGRFGTPNLITTVRLVLTMALLFAYGRQPGWQLAAGAGAILLLDVVDGWIARRTGQSSAFGAAYDVEADAFLVIAIAVLLQRRGIAGGWVLLAGLLRYLYVLVPAIIPTPVGQAPRSRHGRVMYVTMLSCFMLALVVPRDLGHHIALFGTVAITLSFSHSFWQRYSSASLSA